MDPLGLRIRNQMMIAFWVLFYVRVPDNVGINHSIEGLRVRGESALNESLIFSVFFMDYMNRSQGTFQ